MQSIISIVAEVIGIFSALAGGIIWYISRLLNHKKDMLILQLQFETLLERVKGQDAKIKELEEEIKDNRKNFEHWKDNKHKDY
jgi:hypothetical protein